MPLFEKGDLDIEMTGKDAHKGSSRSLIEEPLIRVLGKKAEVTFHGTMGTGDFINIKGVPTRRLFGEETNRRIYALDSLDRN